MVEVAVTIVCGVDAQRFSTKMIFSTSVGSKGGVEIMQLPWDKAAQAERKHNIQGIVGRSTLGIFM